MYPSTDILIRGVPMACLFINGAKPHGGWMFEQKWLEQASMGHWLLEGSTALICWDLNANVS